MVKDVNCWEYVAEANGLETKKERKNGESVVYTWMRKTSPYYHLIHQSHRVSQNAILSVTSVHTCGFYPHLEILFVPADQFIMLMDYYWKSVRNFMLLQNILLLRS